MHRFSISEQNPCLDIDTPIATPISKVIWSELMKSNGGITCKVQYTIPKGMFTGAVGAIETALDHDCGMSMGTSMGGSGPFLTPISSYIVGPCTSTEIMALNGYINICILWQDFSNWSPIYSLG